MAVAMSSTTPSAHRTAKSMPGYFEYQPLLQSERATIGAAMEGPKVQRLDAFHERQSVLYDRPKDAHIYARRALPPIPAVPILRKASSTASLASPSKPSRPTISHTASYQVGCGNDRPLPPLPSPHQRVPSTGSAHSSKIVDSEAVLSLQRPRTARSTSFRNFFHRNTYPPTMSDSGRSVSSMSAASDISSRDSRHDSVNGDDCMSQCKGSTPSTTAPGSRRPSTLSMASMRSRRVTPPEREPPPVPRPVSTRKASMSHGSGRRWALFSQQGHPTDDQENIPPVPITPPANANELSCRPCYYYNARNCNGWVMGGSHGESCESCTMLGFFGSP